MTQETEQFPIECIAQYIRHSQTGNERKNFFFISPIIFIYYYEHNSMATS